MYNHSICTFSRGALPSGLGQHGHRKSAVSNMIGESKGAQSCIVGNSSMNTNSFLMSFINLGSTRIAMHRVSDLKDIKYFGFHRASNRLVEKTLLWRACCRAYSETGISGTRQSHNARVARHPSPNSQAQPIIPSSPPTGRRTI